MAPGKRTEELAIDHVRNPCEWMPVSRMKSGKRPADSRERNTTIHHWILLDIRKVIQSNEVVPDHLRVNPKRHYRQAEQHENVRSLERCSSACISSATRSRHSRVCVALA